MLTPTYIYTIEDFYIIYTVENMAKIITELSSLVYAINLIIVITLNLNIIKPMNVISLIITF